MIQYNMYVLAEEREKEVELYHWKERYSDTMFSYKFPIITLLFKIVIRSENLNVSRTSLLNSLLIGFITTSLNQPKDEH